MLAPLYCWQKNVFPLARVEVETASQSTAIIHAIECRDDEWAIDYELPPIRTLQLRLEGLGQVDPQHGRRGALEAEIDGEQQVLEDSDEPVARGVERLLRAHDPDLIVTEWGDSTLLPALMRQAERLGFELSLNRDQAPVERSRSRSYMSYGRILYKGSATKLAGRLHVDLRNSFIAHQCELDGLWELVRITRLPVQYSARTSTGTGISYMQMEMAYRDGTLIPAQKAEPETPKHPDELLLADRGGLVFPPRLGFFENAAELDFASEYPNIMARFNVSPETVNCRCCPDAPRVPELGYRVCQKRRGITSRVVERLIAKRSELKKLLNLRDATPSVFHQRHIGRVLRSSCRDRGRRLASSCGREPRPGRCPPLWPRDVPDDGGSVAAAGADAIQLFDSWVGALSPQDYAEFVSPYSQRILEAAGVPTIHFGTGVSSPLLAELTRTGGDAIGLDWRTPLDAGWLVAGPEKAVQGNLDPAALLAPTEAVRAATRRMLASAPPRGFIANLGHGILPDTPLESVAAFLAEVRGTA